MTVSQRGCTHLQSHQQCEFLSLPIFSQSWYVNLLHVSHSNGYVTGILVWVFISLVIRKRSLFIYSLTVWISSSVKSLFKFFAQFSTGLYFISYWFIDSLYSLNTSLLFVFQIINIFSYSYWSLWHNPMIHSLPLWFVLFFFSLSCLRNLSTP